MESKRSDIMEKSIGYITFKGENSVQENEEYNGKYIVFPSIEDSLKFSSPSEEKTIAMVEASDPFELADDDYYGYYNMIGATKVKIIHVLDYQEIITTMLDNSKRERARIKFLQGYKVHDEDLHKFEATGLDTWEAVEYYQRGNKSIYREGIGEKVKRYGKYNN